MRHIISYLPASVLMLAGLLGTTLSVPLQAPVVIWIGITGLLTAAFVVKSDSSVAFNGWGLWVAILAACYFVCRAIASPVNDLGIEDLMLILPASILYIVAGYGVSGKSGATLRQSLAWVVVLLLGLHLGSAVVQLFGSEGYSLTAYFTSASRASEEHVTGMYSYYGSFANFAVIAGLLCVSLAVWGRIGIGIRCALFFLGAGALALAVWSQSRSAVLSLVLALCVFGVLVWVSLSNQHVSYRGRARGVLLLSAVLGLLAGIGGGIWVFKERAREVSSGATDMVFDSVVRMPFWSMAAEQWADHPLVGAGSRSYSYECFRYWSPNLPTEQANPEFVHNEYLQLLADYGLIGLLLILILMGWHLFIGVKRVRQLSSKVGEFGMKKGSNSMALTIAGVCGMIAMAVHITFDFRTHLLANLMLFVCCAVWVLPVMKSRSLEVLKSGSSEVGKSRIANWCLVFVLLVLSLGAVGLGGQQLWAGLPLIEHREAKEDGAWSPQNVDRGVWIPMLEESVARAGNWRRYQRLGTLYRLAAEAGSGDEKQGEIAKAIKAYETSIELHRFNPIPKINLASIYTESGQWQKADEAYRSASEMAKARERWFWMHSQWAKMHRSWAAALIQQNKLADVEDHFLRAKELYQLSYDYGYFYQYKRWVVEYTNVLIFYARFLDRQERYSEAEVLFQEGKKQVNWYNWQTDTRLNFYYAQHLYEQGKKLWYQRHPEQALALMEQAKKALIQYRGSMKGEIGRGWQDQMSKIQEVIDFLKQTGVQSADKQNKD